MMTITLTNKVDMMQNALIGEVDTIPMAWIESVGVLSIKQVGMKLITHMKTYFK